MSHECPYCGFCFPGEAIPDHDVTFPDGTMKCLGSGGQNPYCTTCGKLLSLQSSPCDDLCTACWELAEAEKRHGLIRQAEWYNQFN